MPRGARGWDLRGPRLVGERGIQLRIQVRLALVAIARLPSVAVGRQRSAPSSLDPHSRLEKSSVLRVHPGVEGAGLGGVRG